MESELLTPEEVAELTRLKLSTIRLKIWEGRDFPVVRLGRRTLVKKKDVLEWIEKNTQPPKIVEEEWK